MSVWLYWNAMVVGLVVLECNGGWSGLDPQEPVRGTQGRVGPDRDGLPAVHLHTRPAGVPAKALAC